MSRWARTARGELFNSQGHLGAAVAAADPALLYRPSMRVEAGTLTSLEPTHGCEREVGGERERETEEHRKTAKQMTSRLRHQENEGCVVYLRQVHADYRDHANFWLWTRWFLKLYRRNDVPKGWILCVCVNRLRLRIKTMNSVKYQPNEEACMWH